MTTNREMTTRPRSGSANPAPSLDHRWDVVLMVVLAGVTMYGVVMAIAPRLVSDRLFAPLGFGLDRVGDVAAKELDYVAFVFRVLGAVIVGWMVALAGVAVGPLRRREAWAWWTVAGSMIVWFALDTGMSVAIGEFHHAAFNGAFLVPVVVSLLAIKRDLR